MKKNDTLRNAALLLFGATSICAAAQTPIVVEAENPIETFEAKEVSDWSDVENCEASGKKGLGIDRAFRGGYLQYVVEAPEAGTYDMEVRYVSMNTRWIEVKINEQVSQLICCDELTGGWNGAPGETEDEDGNIVMKPGVASKTVKVYLNKGENFFKVNAIYGYSPEEGRDQPFTPNLDCFVFTPSEVQIEKPADWTDSDQLKFECESADAKSGNAGSDERVGFPSGRGGTISANSEPMVNTLSYNVEVPVEGVYKMTISYATCQTRWIGVKVNQQIPSYLCFNDFTPGWNGEEWSGLYQKTVYLKKGMNTITLGNYTKTGKWASDHGDSPALDFFTLDLVSFPEMTEPEKETAAYRLALSDIADWSSGNLDLAAIRDHNEHTVATAAGNEASFSLQFPFPVLISGYSWASANDTSDWKVEFSNDGQSWTEAEAPVAVNEKAGVSTYILPNPMDGAGAFEYARVTISGNQPASIGDFAIFGNPCASEECHLPSGFIPQGFEGYSTDQEGFDTGDWHEGIDKLFDGFSNTQYTVRNEEQGENDTFYVEMWLDEECVVKSYLLSTHYSESYYSSRAPRSWKLEAFDYDADSFMTIDSRENVNFAVPGSTMVANVADYGFATDGYRLEISGRSGRDTHLSGIQLFAEELVKTPVSSAPAPAAPAVKAAVSVNDDVVEIFSSEAAHYAVYSIAGATVASGEVKGSVCVRLSAGLYIVKVGEKSVKLIVK